jgi:hypothetical protein
MKAVIPPLLDIQIEKDILEQAITTWFSNMKLHIDSIPADVNSQVELLSKIRMGLYEDLNQLQHMALIIKVAEHLQKMHPTVTKWHWHAKQTSHPDYADLTGYGEDNLILNAEVTTSLKPVGTIDQRIMSTLTSLNKKEGLKFYFVTTDEMLNRALSKKNRQNFDIDIQKV